MHWADLLAAKYPAILPPTPDPRIPPGRAAHGSPFPPREGGQVVRSAPAPAREIPPARVDRTTPPPPPRSCAAATGPPARDLCTARYPPPDTAAPRAPRSPRAPPAPPKMLPASCTPPRAAPPPF